jgi:hypothetical protein
MYILSTAAGVFKLKNSEKVLASLKRLVSGVLTHPLTIGKVREMTTSNVVGDVIIIEKLKCGDARRHSLCPYISCLGVTA